MKMRSLTVVLTPRQRHELNVGFMMDIDTRIQQIQNRERMILGLKILAGIAALALCYWIMATALDKPQPVYTSYDHVEMM